MLLDRGDLAIAQLVFWVPALILAVICCFRQGLKRQSAWVSLVLLGISRIIYGSCTIAYETENNPSRGLLTAATITGSLGISFLLVGMVGTQLRLFETMRGQSLIPPRLIRLIYLAITAAIIVGIIGATKVQSIDATQDKINTGYDMLKASTIIYVVVFVIMLGLLVISVFKVADIARDQRLLVWAMVISQPFVFVRLLYSLLTVFKHSGAFNLFAPSVWAQAFMQVFEEFVFAILFLIAGFLVPRPAEDTREQKAPPQYQV